MSYIVVDVEADGPIPHKYSMVSFGAILVEQTLTKTFYGKTRPVSDIWVPEALASCNTTREEHLTFDDPLEVMQKFDTWLRESSKGNPVFVSDNPAFDWQFINYYSHLYLGRNPFGFSARRIGDLYCGMKMDTGLNSEWKRKLRVTKHTHHPVDDAKGNAEALLKMKEMGLKINLL